MDPLTATMNAVAAALTLATKVWDATPAAQQQAAAADWAKVSHDALAFFTGLQDKINAAIGVTPAKTS